MFLLRKGSVELHSSAKPVRAAQGAFQPLPHTQGSHCLGQEQLPHSLAQTFHFCAQQAPSWLGSELLQCPSTVYDLTASSDVEVLAIHLSDFKQLATQDILQKLTHEGTQLHLLILERILA